MITLWKLAATKKRISRAITGTSLASNRAKTARRLMKAARRSGKNKALLKYENNALLNYYEDSMSYGRVLESLHYYVLVPRMFRNENFARNLSAYKTNEDNSNICYVKLEQPLP